MSDEAPVEGDGFRAQHLTDPPLVYVWIPIGIVGVILFVCFVRACRKPAKNKGASSRAGKSRPPDHTAPAARALSAE